MRTQLILAVEVAQQAKFQTNGFKDLSGYHTKISNARKRKN